MCLVHMQIMSSRQSHLKQRAHCVYMDRRASFPIKQAPLPSRPPSVLLRREMCILALTRPPSGAHRRSVTNGPNQINKLDYLAGRITPTTAHWARQRSANHERAFALARPASIKPERRMNKHASALPCSLLTSQTTGLGESVSVLVLALGARHWALSSRLAGAHWDSSGAAAAH